MTESDYAYQKVDARLVVGGVEVPASALSVDYELNGIPRAAFQIPTGRDAETGKASPVRDLLARDEPMKVEAYVTCSGKMGDFEDFGLPDGEAVKVFEGTTAGFGYRRSRSQGRAFFNLAANHWLGDVDQSSIFSRWSHPSNPAQYSAGLIVRSGGTGAATDPVYWGPLDAKDALKESNIREDLWGKTLLPFFQGLAESEGLYVPEQGESSGGKNDLALAVLGRIRSPIPLKLRITADSGLDTAIREHLQAALADPGELASHTMWDVLLSALAGSFLFAVVPRVEDALVVTYGAAVREAYAEIDLDSYDDADLSGRIPRPIRAVGVLGRYDSSTGLGGPASSDPRTARFLAGGWYEPDADAKGAVHIESPPPWASRCVPATRYAPRAAGAFGGRVATADRPRAAGPPDEAAARAAGEGAEEARGFLERFARTRMAHLRTLDRQGPLFGPLRLDVAPGSSLRFAVAGDPAAGGVDAVFYGTALRTSLAVSAEGRTARTGFHVAHLRTEAENESEAWALDEHPLYAELFKGAPLRGD